MRQPSSPYDLTLNLAAEAWLRELPQQVAPAALASQFPRIANRLARFWDSPRMIDEYMEQLLIPKRSKRKGFPDKVLAELYALSEYHRARRAGAQNRLWDSLPYRKP